MSTVKKKKLISQFVVVEDTKSIKNGVPVTDERILMYVDKIYFDNYYVNRPFDASLYYGSLMLPEDFSSGLIRLVEYVNVESIRPISIQNEFREFIRKTVSDEAKEDV